MPEIQDAAVGRELRRRFSVVGEGAIATLSPEIVPVVMVDDISERLAMGSRDRRRAIGTTNLPASVGNVSETQLFNASNSGVVAVVEACVIRVDTGSGIGVLIHNTELASAAASVGAFRDFGLPGAPATRVRDGQPAAIDGTTRAIFYSPSDFPYIVPLDIRLPPGTGLVVGTVDTNRAFVATWFWVEQAVDRL